MPHAETVPEMSLKKSCSYHAGILIFCYVLCCHSISNPVVDKDFSVIGVVQTQNKHLCLLQKSYYKTGFPPTSQFLPEL